jgi:hypothetical protein
MSSIKDTLGDRPFSAPAKDSLPWLATQINLENQAAGSALAGLDHALKCGELLNTAKRKVRHGEWGDWLAENCPDVSERSAQVYRRLADHIDLIKAKTAALRFSELSLRAATKLISATLATAAPVEPEPQSGFAPYTSASQRAAAPLVPSTGSDMPDLPPALDRSEDSTSRRQRAQKTGPAGPGWDAVGVAERKKQGLPPKLDSYSWSFATDDERTKFICQVTLPQILKAIPLWLVADHRHMILEILTEAAEW